MILLMIQILHDCIYQNVPKALGIVVVQYKYVYVYVYIYTYCVMQDFYHLPPSA